MSAGIASLHKVLKDETRRKIIILLSDKGSLSYVDLMKELQITSTGKINYHLKILSNLLTKNEAGQYTLTEKGTLASRLLLEFPEGNNELRTKKIWWRRFWVVAILLQAVWLSIFLALYFLGSIDFYHMALSLVGFTSGIIFLYFFYRMIRPINQRESKKDQSRTVENVLVSGRTMQEINEAVMDWIKEEGISIEAQRDGFVRGRLGIPSGLGLTAPKYFEVFFKPDHDGVTVRIEGWISLFDVSERSFSRTRLAAGGIPRRKGWVVMEHLCKRLKAMSK
jgi:hypothetical protein